MTHSLPSLDQVRALLRSVRPAVVVITAGKAHRPCGIAHRDGSFGYIDNGRRVLHRRSIPAHILDQMPSDEAARLRRKGAAAHG